jgi:hypothetical protein
MDEPTIDDIALDDEVAPAADDATLPDFAFDAVLDGEFFDTLDDLTAVIEVRQRVERSSERFD